MDTVSTKYTYEFEDWHFKNLQNISLIINIDYITFCLAVEFTIEMALTILVFTLFHVATRKVKTTRVQLHVCFILSWLMGLDESFFSWPLRPRAT